MKLYDCTVAPSPRRVRIFAAEKGLDLQKVEVDLIGGENLQPEFLKINPRGVVQTLELDDGTRIDEVVAICLCSAGREDHQVRPRLHARRTNDDRDRRYQGAHPLSGGGGAK